MAESPPEGWDIEVDTDVSVCDLEIPVQGTLIDTV